MTALSPRFASVLAVAIAMTLGCNWTGKPQLEDPPLNAERVRVYGDFLDIFSSLHFRRIANQTAPFAPSDLPQGSPCVHGMVLENQSSARRVLHRFGPEIISGRDLILVDPIEQARILEQKEIEGKSHGDKSQEELIKMTERVASDYGFLALSEIVFDQTHRFAVLKYLYFCGSRCKQGGTLVMEKVGSSWTASTRRPCTTIIN
jgi:hypothetical protein